MAIGHFLFRGDKTACGGRILEGCPDHQFFDKDMACEGDLPPRLDTTLS